MIKIDDFKAGGSQRKYITHTGVLPEIDGDILSDEQKRKLIEKCYTMCDGYIAEEATVDPNPDPVDPKPGDGDEPENSGEDQKDNQVSESVDETESKEVGKTEKETQESTSDPVDDEVSTADDTKSE